MQRGATGAHVDDTVLGTRLDRLAVGLPVDTQRGQKRREHVDLADLCVDRRRVHTRPVQDEGDVRREVVDVLAVAVLQKVVVDVWPTVGKRPVQPPGDSTSVDPAVVPQGVAGGLREQSSDAVTVRDTLAVVTDDGDQRVFGGGLDECPDLAVQCRQRPLVRRLAVLRAVVCRRHVDVLVELPEVHEREEGFGQRLESLDRGLAPVTEHRGVLRATVVHVEPAVETSLGDERPRRHALRVECLGQQRREWVHIWRETASLERVDAVTLGVRARQQAGDRRRRRRGTGVQVSTGDTALTQRIEVRRLRSFGV